YAGSSGTEHTAHFAVDLCLVLNVFQHVGRKDDVEGSIRKGNPPAVIFTDVGHAVPGILTAGYFDAGRGFAGLRQDLQLYPGATTDFEQVFTGEEGGVPLEDSSQLFLAGSVNVSNVEHVLPACIMSKPCGRLHSEGHQRVARRLQKGGISLWVLVFSKTVTAEK